MILRKIFIAALALFLWANLTYAQINRPYEPIVLTGDTLSQFINYEIQYLYLYAYDANLDSWQMIPFQFDEVNSDTVDSLKYFVPEDSLGGLFDHDDELAFMLGDLGDQADSTNWLNAADSIRYEICFIDTLNDQKGYVYLYFLNSVSELVPNTYAMAYDSLNDRVISANYEVGFNSTGQLSDVMINPDIRGSGEDIFDRLKIRLMGSYWIFPIPLYENHVERFYAYAKAGPIRVIRNMYGRFYYDLAGVFTFDEPFTQTSFFYPWGGDFTLVDIPVEEAADVGAEVDVFRVSWDFNSNARGMKFFSEYNRIGSLIDGDGTDDNIDPSCSPGELNWTMGTGNPGTILNIFYVPHLGDNIRIYYYEATDGTSGDNFGLKFDSGDDSSFADNGFSLEGNIEQYAATESTLNVIYYNFFLPPDFDPDDASIICEQLKSPLKIEKIIQKFSLPSELAQDNKFAPTKFRLEQNYPNPFNSATTISFSLPKRTEVSLRIYDILGRLIYTLVDQNLAVGNYKYVWQGINNDGMPVPSGFYFYELNSTQFQSTKKLLLIK